MSDIDALLRAWLAAQPPLHALCAERILVGSDLFAGYTVAQGPAVLLTNLGGRWIPNSPMLATVYSAQCYAESVALAQNLDQTLVAVLHRAAWGTVRMCTLQVSGRVTRTPTHWPVVVSNYQVVSVPA